MNRRFAALLIATSLAGLALPAVRAAPPEPVVITAHPTQFCCPELGGWAASGGITDSGTFVRTEVATAPPDRAFGVPGPVRETFDFTGQHGTMTVRAEYRETGEGIEGVWQVASGTREYADASGHGTVAFSASPGLFTLTLSGVISKV
jgi:hypothetical protein